MTKKLFFLDVPEAEWYQIFFCYLRAAREVGPYEQPITIVFSVGTGGSLYHPNKTTSKPTTEPEFELNLIWKFLEIPKNLFSKRFFGRSPTTKG